LSIERLAHEFLEIFLGGEAYNLLFTSSVGYGIEDYAKSLNLFSFRENEFKSTL